jgi:hypothetical protein
MYRNRSLGAAGLLLTLLAFGSGCDPVEGVGPGTGFDPRALDGEFSWIFLTWEQGTPRGYPAVDLTWEVPPQFNREVFRVYSRRASAGSYVLVATVTSCSGGVCLYRDRNVIAGQSYDYFIATVDERDGAEIGASTAVRVDVPHGPSLPPPGGLTATALDDAVFLTWSHTGAQRYMVVVQPENGTTFLIGESDGSSFFDDRAENGLRYRYFVAAVGDHGHVGALSPAAEAIPRPDFYADIVYAHADHPTASGFRFVSAETQDPIVPGTSAQAQWRLEFIAGTPRIQPLGQTAITSGTFTTQLTCGPGSDATCVDLRVAPPAGSFGTASVVAETGRTYVLRVIGPDNRVHFAKLRVQGAGLDGQGRRLIVFDWAYQLRPDEPSLNLTAGEG